MGRMLSSELASGDFGIPLESAMTYHLRNNHYPPVPHSMVSVCIEAIEAYSDGLTEKLIALPCDGLDRNGEPFQITWRGERFAPANTIIEANHLWEWVTYDND